MTCTLKDVALEHMNWVAKIIGSCRDTFQLECAKKLIEVFNARYADDELSTELFICYQARYNHIHQILN